MKVAGKTLAIKNRRGVLIVRDDGRNRVELPLAITPLPMGFWQKMRVLGLMAPPSPPRREMRDAKGMLIRNPDTGLVEMVPDLDDQKYQWRRETHYRRLEALEFVEMLRDDASVEWATEPPKSKDRADWEAYADAIWKEMEEAGFTEGEVHEIIKLGVKLESGVRGEDAFDRFLPQRPEEAETPAEAS